MHAVLRDGKRTAETENVSFCAVYQRRPPRRAEQPHASGPPARQLRHKRFRSGAAITPCKKMIADFTKRQKQKTYRPAP